MCLQAEMTTPPMGSNRRPASILTTYAGWVCWANDDAVVECADVSEKLRPFFLAKPRDFVARLAVTRVIFYPDSLEAHVQKHFHHIVLLAPTEN